MTRELVVEGVRLSNPDRILYPEQGITKRELAEYHVAVAPVMLPHVAMRPITLVRCPTGRQKTCFYQRHAGAGLGRQVERVKMPGFDNPYLYISDLPGLVGLAQMGVLEIHPWGVRVERPACADRLILDLDPSEELGFDAVVAAALDLRERLARLGLASFVKTTGGKGLHLVLPLAPVHDWPEVKAWARAFAEAAASDAPDTYLTRIGKAERRGRIFIDYLRNDPTSTAVAPYSPRARPGAPVAFPLDWEEVRPGLDPAAFHLRSVPALVANRPDPWEEMDRLALPLPDLRTTGG